MTIASMSWFWKALLGLQLLKYTWATGVLHVYLKKYTPSGSKWTCDLNDACGKHFRVQKHFCTWEGDRVRRSPYGWKLERPFTKLPLRRDDCENVTLSNVSIITFNNTIRNTPTEETQKKFVFESSRGRISGSFRVICDPNFYPPYCDKYCAPNDDIFGHYRCSKYGKKVCLEYWTDPDSNCTTMKKQCFLKQYCHNGGQCVNKTCVCRLNWGGPTCTTFLKLTCSKNASVCANGGVCRDLISSEGVRCDCSDTGFTGDKCDDDIDECKTSSCGRKKRCVNSIGSYRCECKKPFYGSNCEKCNVRAQEGFWKCKKIMRSNHYVWALLTISLVGVFVSFGLIILTKTLIELIMDYVSKRMR